MTLDENQGAGNRASPEDEIADQVASLLASLEIDSADLLARCLALQASVSRMPAAVYDDETAGRFTDMVRMMRACRQAADLMREQRKTPYLRLGEAVHGYFVRTFLAPLDERREIVESRLGAYLDRKAAAARAAAQAAERELTAAELPRVRSDMGGLATQQAHYTGELLGRATLELEPLRPHFTVDALNKAIRAYVKAGGRKLEGARIWETRDTRVR